MGWTGAEETTINNYYNRADNLEYALKCELTEANCSITYQAKLTGILPGDKCPCGLALK